MTREAEVAVIGSCLCLDEGALLEALSVVEPVYFSSPEHRAIFGAILDLHKAGKPVDAITVGESLPPEKLREVGGQAYIFDIVGRVPSALNVQHYAEIVRRRHFQSRFTAAARRAMENPEDERTLESLRQALRELESDHSGIVSMAQVAHAYVSTTLNDRAMNQVMTFKTGFPSLDRLRQFAPGQMHTIGAKTSHGKTALMLRMAVNMAKAGHRVLFETREMLAKELFDRIISAETGLNSMLIRSERVKDHMQALTSAAAQLSPLPFHFHDKGRFSMSVLESSVDVLKPDVMFVDYVQMMESPSGADSRSGALAKIAQDLKNLSLSKNLLIIVGSQFNREIDHRGGDSRPTLSDYNGSGGLEHAADIAMAIHMNLDPHAKINTGELLLLKNRNGPKMDIGISLHMGTTKFNEMFDDEPKLF